MSREFMSRLGPQAEQARAQGTARDALSSTRSRRTVDATGPVPLDEQPMVRRGPFGDERAPVHTYHALAQPIASRRLNTAPTSTIDAGDLATDIYIETESDGWIVGFGFDVVDVSGTTDGAGAAITLDAARTILGCTALVGDKRESLFGDGDSEQPIIASNIRDAGQMLMCKPIAANQKVRFTFHNLSETVDGIRAQGWIAFYEGPMPPGAY